MASCPQCQRPIAVARPLCLYCGALLDASLLPAAPVTIETTAPAPAAPPTVRQVIVTRVEGMSVDIVGRALELTPFDAQQRILRRGWQLHRIADPDAAAVESERLRQAGIEVLTLPEQEISAAIDPVMAVGGRASSDGVVLRTPASHRLVASDLLLVVVGPIERGAMPDPDRKRAQLGPFEPGFRFHFHVREESRPIELDPGSFVFDGGREHPLSSLLEIKAWLDRLAPAPIDDDFKHAAPALAPAAEEPSLLKSLRSERRRKDAAAVMLDNLRQFRFYSGLRAAICRRA
jgi:hypothetical protein